MPSAAQLRPPQGCADGGDRPRRIGRSGISPRNSAGDMRRRWRPPRTLTGCHTQRLYGAGLLRGPDPLQAQEVGPTRTRKGKRRKLKSARMPYRYASIQPPRHPQDIGHRDAHTHTPAPAFQRSSSATFRGGAAYRRRADSTGIQLNPSGAGWANRTAPCGDFTARSGELAPCIPIQAGRGKFTHTGMPNSGNLLIGVGFRLNFNACREIALVGPRRFCGSILIYIISHI